MRWTVTDPITVIVMMIALAIVMTILQRVGAWLERRKEIARIGETWGQPLRHRRHDRPIAARERDAPPLAGTDRIDDGTWADLELDRVFHRIDRTLTAIGAQTLYRWLRQPLVDPAAMAERRAMVEAVADDSIRVRLQAALARLDDRYGWEATAVITRTLPTIAAPVWLLRALPIAMIGTLVGASIRSSLPLLIVGLALAAVLPVVHYLSNRAIGHHLEALAELRRAMSVAIELERIDPAAARGRLGATASRLNALRRALGGGGRSRGTGFAAQAPEAAAEYGNAFLLVQLVAYTKATRAIAARRDDYASVLDWIGGIDAALAIAYLRAHEAELVAAQIDPEAPGMIARSLRHPLVDGAVGNDLELGPMGLLITGSNMGGKSTLLRATGIAAVLAQSIGLVPADSYRARPLRIASLMNIVDDPIAGVSLFRAEVDRILALVQRADEPGTHLFLLDETFRGTNPAERIAASVAVLRWLSRAHLVMVATHDRELCDRLADRFHLAYFTEHVDADDVVFDYRLRPGVLHTTNAIALLERAGYPPALVAEARRIAQRD